MDEPRPQLKATHYQVASVAGLALLFAGQLVQGIELANFLVALVGMGALVTRRPAAPLLFLLLFAAVQLTFAASRPLVLVNLEARRLFAPADLMLAAGALIFLGSTYRLHGLQIHIVPPDTRLLPMRGPGRPAPPLPPKARAERGLRAEELAAFLFAVPFFVLAGQAIGQLLQRPVNVLGFKPSFVRVALVVWFAVVGLVGGGALFSYWRRAQADVETAQLFLQEVVWRQLRRESNRLARWLAWGKRRPKDRRG